MSRTLVYANGRIEVVAGYDPPLGEYFAQVFSLDVGEDEEETLAYWVGADAIDVISQVRRYIPEDQDVLIMDAVEKMRAAATEPWTPGAFQRSMGFVGNYTRTSKLVDMLAD